MSHACNEIEFTPEELNDIYERRKDKLDGVTKEAFQAALVVAAGHFRHKMGNIENAKILYKEISDSSKSKMKDLEIELQCKNEEIRILKGMLTSLVKVA